MVCHGGFGTVRGGLTAGVPMAVLPLFADQPYNAARVAEIGAGIALDAAGRPGSPGWRPPWGRCSRDAALRRRRRRGRGRRARAARRSTPRPEILRELAPPV